MKRLNQSCFMILPNLFCQLSISPKNCSYLASKYKYKYDWQTINTVPPCYQYFSTSMSWSWTLPRLVYFSLLYAYHTLFLRWRRRMFLEMFILKRWQFSCILGSGGHVNNNRQWTIDQNPWWVTFIYSPYMISDWK